MTREDIERQPQADNGEVVRQRLVPAAVALAAFMDAGPIDPIRFRTDLDQALTQNATPRI